LKQWSPSHDTMQLDVISRDASDYVRGEGSPKLMERRSPPHINKPWQLKSDVGEIHCGNEGNVLIRHYVVKLSFIIAITILV